MTDPMARRPTARLSPERRRALLPTAAAGVLLAFASCWSAHGAEPDHLLEVTATAYTSHPEQTWGDPFEAAWGDRLGDGVRGIAVSRDLLRAGLERGTEVRIEGLPGTYTVLDKMHGRWRRRIDIYMGTDRREARRWGRRDVEIYW